MKKRYSFLLVEILIALSIVGIVLTGFFSYFTYVSKSKIGVMNEYKMDVIADELFLEIITQKLNKKEVPTLPTTKGQWIDFEPQLRSTSPKTSTDFKVQYAFQQQSKKIRGDKRGYLVTIHLRFDKQATNKKLFFKTKEYSHRLLIVPE